MTIDDKIEEVKKLRKKIHLETHRYNVDWTTVNVDIRKFINLSNSVIDDKLDRRIKIIEKEKLTNKRRMKLMQIKWKIFLNKIFRL